MKKSRFQLSVFILTLACLFGLVGIQINWILKAAKTQESQFTYGVNMAMNRIVENLAMDRAICREVTSCLREGKGSSCYIMMKNRAEWANIGSMIKKDLKYYGITLDFEFDIVDSNKGKKDNSNKKVESAYFSDDLVDALQQTGYELKIKFPEKRDFIIAQIGYIFIISIVLLILVSLSIILIFGFYKKEKKLTENIVDFINNMTHEFKTPLTNIALANSMISKSDIVENDKKLSIYTSIIKTEHDKLKQRVEELLKTSFSEAGSPVFNESIEVSYVIENVIENYSVQIKEKGGSFTFEKEEDKYNIIGNADLFHIALGNIVDNAIRYCIHAPEIKILLTLKTKSVIIDISDNGIGIAKDQQSQIFGKYYRVPTGNVHDNNGFGLGLFHVKNIVQRMGGKIRVKSSIGKGSMFSLEFPVAEYK